MATYHCLEGETVIWQKNGTNAVILSPEGESKVFISQGDNCILLEISTLKQILKELK